MSSTFWFLLEFTVLLALAAGVFAWLGWMWRGSERGDRVKKLQDEVEEQRRLARAAMDERDAARAESSTASGSVHVSEAAPLIQANEVLENENVRLREDRKNLESKLATLQADNAHLFSQSSANLAEALKKQHQLETDLALAQAFASEAATLRQQLADAKVAHQSEVSTIQQKLSAADEADEQLSALREQNVALAAETQKATEAAQNAQTSLEASRAENTALQQKIAAASATSENAAQATQSELTTLRDQLTAATLEAQNARAEVAALQQKLTAASATSESAAQTTQSELTTLRDQLTAATREEQNARAQLAAFQQKLTEASATSENAAQATQSELTSLRDQLTAATRDAQSARAELSAFEQKLAQSSAKIAEAEQVSQSQLSTLRDQLAAATREAQSARAELSTLKQKLAAAPPPAPAPLVQPIVKPVVEVPAPVPAPQVGKAAPKPRATKKKPSTTTAHNAQEKLAEIETALAPQLSILAALTQERDDWQRRVTMLESKTPPDLAGLGLARRSLGSSAERLSEAQSAVESLQNQQRALHKTLQQTTALATQPDDDLTQIKGIKGVLSDQLHALGIRTWRQIAEWNDDDLLAFSELLAFKNRATRDHWQEQARLLAQQ
jgi:predicted flap endonuclease-1-like 5' DNA nuclease